MQVTIHGIPLTLLKTNDDWGVYPRNSQLPIWMRWNGEDWYFISEDTPAELKAIEEDISLYIEMRGE